MQVGVPSIREHMAENAAASGEYHAKRVDLITKARVAYGIGASEHLALASGCLMRLLPAVSGRGW